MKISIITPSLNQAQYLEETILSVINQNYPNLEYIIIDGGSTDSSVKIIKKYENLLAYWISEKDKGQSDAINKGIKKATGDIVAWLNSDDLYLPGTLHTVSKCFYENPDTDLVYGDVENFSKNDPSEIYINPPFELTDFLSRVSIHQPSVFWKRKLHDTIDYLDESLHYCMDYDFWIRIFLNYKTLKINKPLSRFRIHPDSKTSANPPELYLEYRKIFSKFINSVYEAQLYKKQLAAIGIYDNIEELKYTFTSSLFSKNNIEAAVNKYIFNCGIQEYTWKNKKKANLLFKESLAKHFFKSILFLLKNNLS